MKILVKNFASVLIFMDNGHISKIRSKSNRPGRSRRHNKKLVLQIKENHNTKIIIVRHYQPMII